MGRPRKYADSKEATRERQRRKRKRDRKRDRTVTSGNDFLSTWSFSGKVNFPPRSEEATIVAVTAFYCGNGRIVKDDRGFRSAAYADSPHKLEPLLILGTTKITRRGKRFYWNSYKKAHAEWLAANIKFIFRPKPPKLPKGVCPHCLGEDGVHDPECVVGGGAD